MPPSSLATTLRGSLALITLVLAWCGVLWWLIAPDFASLRPFDLATLHAGPPVLCWSGWRFWLGYRERRQTAAMAKIEERAEQDREAALATAKAAHASEQQRVRFGCDCRAVAMTQLIAASDEIAEGLAGRDVAYISMQASEIGTIRDTLLDHLGCGIEEVLGAIFERCPAALAFPIYVVPQNDLSGEGVVASIRKHRSERLTIPWEGLPLGTETPCSIRVAFLPQRDSVANSVIDLFETQPDLPGAVVLAFDSPWWRRNYCDSGEQGDFDAGEDRVPPAQGVFALVVTHPDLSEILTALSPDDSSNDSMTPHWARSANRVGSPAGLSGLSAATLESLMQNKPLARIHRAASAAGNPGVSRRLELAQCLATLIERAQINSAQIDIAFSASTESDAGSADPLEERAGCGWLVHNAGESIVGGQRLASLGAALFRRGLDVEPIDEATNVSQVIGDLGCARELAALALAVTHAALGARNVLSADFYGDDQISVFFVAASAEAA